MRTSIIGVGANLGSREANIEAASFLLSEAGVSVTAVSPLYETEPVGPPQPSYLNAAFRIETTLAIEDLLQLLQSVERSLGRVRDPKLRWGPRTIDLDILYSDDAVDRPGLVVPHTHLKERSFALAPLLDVASGLSDDYLPALEQVGGAPPKWLGAAFFHKSEGDLIVDAEDLSSALAFLAAQNSADTNKPDKCSIETKQVSGVGGAHGWFAALNRANSTGFTILYAPVWHCSKAQWAGVFIGYESENTPFGASEIELGSSPNRRIRVTLRSSTVTISRG